MTDKTIEALIATFPPTFGLRGFPGKVFSKVKDVAKDLFSSGPKADSVTKTKESVTVTPAKKSGGSVKC